MSLAQRHRNTVFYGIAAVFALGAALSGYAAVAAGERSAAAFGDLRAAQSEAAALKGSLAEEEKAASGARILPVRADVPRLLTDASAAAHTAGVELLSVSFGTAVAPGGTLGPPASYLPVSLDLQGARGAVLSCLFALERSAGSIQVVQLQLAKTAAGMVNASVQCRLFFGGNGP